MAGKIEQLNVAGGASIATDTLVQGDNNQVVANSPGGRIATHETSYRATSSPGAIVGTGNTAAGTTVTALQPIDFGQLTGHIRYLADFYARDPNANHIEQRLAALEALMRDGARKPEAREQAKGLALQLKDYLAAFPDAVRLFETILRMLGG